MASSCRFVVYESMNTKKIVFNAMLAGWTTHYQAKSCKFERTLHKVCGSILEGIDDSVFPIESTDPDVCRCEARET